VLDVSDAAHLLITIGCMTVILGVVEAVASPKICVAQQEGKIFFFLSECDCETKKELLQP
jgi:hypothetical protein